MFIFVALISVTFVAIVALKKGLRGTRIGVEPHCNQCGYSLIGRVDSSVVCPECGADVTRPSATVHGERRRRPRWIIAGVTLLLTAVPLTRLAVDALQNLNWLPYEPTSWLLAAAKPPVNSLPALRELKSRVESGSIRDSQIAPVAAAALSMQNTPNLWQDEWGEILESLHFAHRLPDTDWNRYLDHIVHATMTVRHRVNVGAPPVISIKLGSTFERGGLTMAGTWKLATLRINDQLVEPPTVAGDFTAQAHSSSSGSSSSNCIGVMTAGKKHIVATIEGSETITPPAPMSDGHVKAATRPAEHRQLSITLTDDFIVTPPVKLDASAITANQDLMERGLSAVVEHSTGGPDRLRVLSNNLPFPILGRITLRKTDGTPANDFDTSFKAPTLDAYENDFELEGNVVLPIKVVITPSSNGHAGDNDFDDTPLWPNDLLIDVTEKTSPTTKAH